MMHLFMHYVTEFSKLQGHVFLVTTLLVLDYNFVKVYW